MFEEDLESLPTRDLLEQAADCRTVANRADAHLLECAQTYADRFHPSLCPTRPSRRAHDGRERAIVLGGDGCPEIAEFAIAEFAAVVGVSPGVGRDLLADALALRHRFPRTWARIQAGEATPWKARQIVRACTKLDHAAAEYVDRRVAAIIDTIPPHRLEKIARAARKHADPARAATDAAEAADDRGVHVGRGDAHGNKTIYIKAPAAAVNRCNATITDIAEALKTFGDTRPVQHRRADAIHIIADPRFTQELLTQAHNHPQPSDGTTPTATTPENNAPAEHDATMQDDATVQDDESPDSLGPQGLLDLLDLVEPVGPPDDPWQEATAAYDPDPPTDPFDRRTPPRPTDPRTEPNQGSAMDPAALRALHARLAQIKSDAYSNPSHSTHPTKPADPANLVPPTSPPDLGGSDDPSRSDSPGRSDEPTRSDVSAQPGDETTRPGDDAQPGDGTARPGDGTARPNGESRGQVRPTPERAVKVRPGQTEVVVHLTDHTLAAGSGVVRAEDIGPLLATQLTELIGYGPYTVKPVIDLNDAVSVDAYEIPARIRDRVRFTHPVELFPYGTRETTSTIDLDHIEPYDPHGPAGQTSTTNLAPLGRFGHRVKTHAQGWTVRRLDYKTLEWRTPHGFTIHVNPDGTHRINPNGDPPSEPRRDLTGS